ncbi:MAG: hypothetical protein NC038_01655 [Paludibacter sp.]|nr:hypothetical protein [Bacteroidales bacterium]MCM1068915.1 hypothetical protein [Prevotella sp.]MCM1353176.1 hypothetical protein [Bacteroides sp.]MCM1442498.1 hypothetical protein [Muribaculum sp.]MCM1481341.1 hypothetical protein [Paludibacter sp.]
MKRISLSILAMLTFLFVMAQSENVHCMRSAEDEAEKQTEMMQRELQLTPAQRDSVYAINLKYAEARRISNTRGEALERLNAMDAELKEVLTPEQYYKFMNVQLNNGPKRPATVVKRMNQETLQRRTLRGDVDSIR